MIVISHSCDLTNSNLEKEPVLEAISGRLTDPEPNLLFGKNSRRLQFIREDGKALEFVIQNKLTIPRQLLADTQPQEHLPKGDVSTLAKWLAKRYTRPAFPDEFNKRICKVEEKLKKRLKNVGELIVGIWIDVKDAELASNENYEIFVWVVATYEAIQEPSLRAKAQELANLMEGHFKLCKGIKVVGEIVLLSSTQFSLDLYMNTKRWDFDDISLRDESQDLPTA